MSWETRLRKNDAVAGETLPWQSIQRLVFVRYFRQFFVTLFYTVHVVPVWNDHKLQDS